MNKDDARFLLSSQGVYASWYLRPSQLDLYDLLFHEKRPFIEAGRRFGKTTSIACFVMEMLRRNPGWICRWCEPQKDQARKIVMPIMDQIQSFTPQRDKFDYYTTDSVYVNSNGSKLFLLGVNEDKGKSARGPAANIIVADEYGFWNDAAYIIKDILNPQLQAQQGQWLIKASTPPPNLGHVYYDEKEVAIRKGRFIQKTIYDNEALSEFEMASIVEESGGAESPTFRREYLCEAISNPDMLVIPEYDDTLNVVPDDYPRPQFFTPYVGGDSGADDYTFVLFGYYDFQKNETVIEEELVLNGKTTKEIIEQAKIIEPKLWGDVKPKKRVYDAAKQLIYDIFVDHKWPVQMPQKDDKLAAIHDLRVEVGARRFKVKARCKHLRRQMKVGLWKDDRHSDFERTEGLGHLDGIAAAIYFNRCIDTKFNPIPTHHGLSHYTHFITPEPVSHRDSTEGALHNLFGPKARKGF